MQNNSPVIPPPVFTDHVPSITNAILNDVVMMLIVTMTMMMTMITAVNELGHDLTSLSIIR